MDSRLAGGIAIVIGLMGLIVLIPYEVLYSLQVINPDGSMIVSDFVGILIGSFLVVWGIKKYKKTI